MVDKDKNANSGEIRTSDGKGKKPTIKDVAKAANVSIATVSYVLNDRKDQLISDETRRKVLQVANLLNYQCNVMARYLSRGVSQVITVKLAYSSPLASDYNLKLILHLSEIMRQKGYTVSVSTYSESGHTSEPAAIITVGLDRDAFREYASPHFAPVIAVDSVVDDWLFYQVNDDFVAIRDDAVRRFNAQPCYIGLKTSRETQERIDSVFEKTIIVNDYSDLDLKDIGMPIVTVNDSIYRALVALGVDCHLVADSALRKAEALSELVIHAINRDTTVRHDVLV